jgi:hypothetical protein
MQCSDGLTLGANRIQPARAGKGAFPVLPNERVMNRFELVDLRETRLQHFDGRDLTGLDEIGGFAQGQIRKPVGGFLLRHRRPRSF